MTVQDIRTTKAERGKRAEIAQRAGADVTELRGRMKGFFGRLSQEQIARVHAYKGEDAILDPLTSGTSPARKR